MRPADIMFGPRSKEGEGGKGGYMLDEKTTRREEDQTTFTNFQTSVCTAFDPHLPHPHTLSWLRSLKFIFPFSYPQQTPHQLRPKGIMFWSHGAGLVGWDKGHI